MKYILSLNRCLLAAVLCAAISSGAQEKKESAKGAQPKQGKQQVRLPEGVKALRDLEYVPNGHERQKLDLYLPEKGDKLPLIVFVHGGGWRQGSKEGSPAIRFSGNGYAVASINYRLSQHAIWPAQIEDCKAAVRWLRANAAKYRLDPDRIGVWGGSAGGHLVALLGTTGDVKDFDKGENLKFSSRVQAVCDWFGPADFTLWQDSNSDTLTQLFGGKMTKAQALNASPVTYVTKGDAPFLIMHGDKDPLVAMAHSERLRDALKAAGVEVALDVLPGAAHGTPEFRSEESLAKIAAFFDKHLKSVETGK